MADTNYMPKVYHKQGSDEVVVADGGQITIEDGGELDLPSGSIIDVDDALVFYAGEGTFSGANIKALLRSTQVLTWTNLSTGATVLSDNGDSDAPVMLSTYGIINFSCSDGMTDGSCRLYSGLAGQTLLLRFTNADGAAASLHIHASGNDGFTGVKLFGSNGIELSTVAIRQSAASWGWVQLRCFKDGSWAITDADANNVTEMLGA